MLLAICFHDHMCTKRRLITKSDSQRVSIMHAELCLNYCTAVSYLCKTFRERCTRSFAGFLRSTVYKDGVGTWRNWLTCAERHEVWRSRGHRWRAPNDESSCDQHSRTFHLTLTFAVFSFQSQHVNLFFHEASVWVCRFLWWKERTWKYRKQKWITWITLYHFVRWKCLVSCILISPGLRRLHDLLENFCSTIPSSSCSSESSRRPNVADSWRAPVIRSSAYLNDGMCICLAILWPPARKQNWTMKAS